jgi:hypothetical protein
MKTGGRIVRSVCCWCLPVAALTAGIEFYRNTGVVSEEYDCSSNKLETGV